MPLDDVPDANKDFGPVIGVSDAQVWVLAVDGTLGVHPRID